MRTLSTQSAAVRARVLLLGALLCVLWAPAPVAHAAAPKRAPIPNAPSPSALAGERENAKGGEPKAIDSDKLFGAIVKVETRAVPDARSNAALGREREGTGIVIGPGGLILTIGYLIVEADDVKITDNAGRTLPAQVVGYDHATGFGLIRALAPLRATPVLLGDSEKVAEREPMMIASQAGTDEVNFVWVVSRRPFSGSWEYLLEKAIYTSPPAMNWSGAALIDKGGKLIGIGSLIVRDASADGSGLPGNVFIPIELLKPILTDLTKSGRRSGAARPWLGVAADEVQGRLVVTRVSPEGPADRAGIKSGDIIVGVGSDAVRTQADFYRKVWARGSAGDTIPLRVLQDLEVKEVPIRSIDRIEYFKPRTTY